MHSLLYKSFIWEAIFRLPALDCACSPLPGCRVGQCGHLVSEGGNCSLKRGKTRQSFGVLSWDCTTDAVMSPCFNYWHLKEVWKQVSPFYFPSAESLSCLVCTSHGQINMCAVFYLRQREVYWFKIWVSHRIEVCLETTVILNKSGKMMCFKAGISTYLVIV